MSRPLWVLDTNVFVSAVLTLGGACSELIELAVAGHFTPAWDNRILREYRDVLQRPRFRLSETTVRQLLAALPRAGYSPGKCSRLDLPDMDDEPFLAVALATPDRIIVTGNPKRFPKSKLAPHQAAVLSPGAALDAAQRAGFTMMPWK